MNIKNISNLLVILQIAMFYDKDDSYNGNYHVFDISSLLSTLENLGYKIRLYYTKEDYPVLKKIEYRTTISSKIIYANFRKISNFFTMI